MGIWRLPESARLEAQTLDKLATAPWRVLLHNSDTNVPSALLRPLLDDLVEEECYLEMRQPTNQPAQLVFAVHAGKDRTTLWEKNLGMVFESLTGVKPAPKSPGGWSLKKHHTPNLIELAHAGDWTVLGLGQESNPLMDNVLKRIQNDPHCFKSATNYWLEIDLDPARAIAGLSERWSLPASITRIQAFAIGKGENVHTRGTLQLGEPIQGPQVPWVIPTNLIHEPLIGFTAIRGLASWASASKLWNKLEPGPPPSQVFFWAVDGVPYQSYFAATVPDTSNRVYRFSAQLQERANPWLAQHGMGVIQQATNGNGFDWVGVPFMMPHVRVVPVGNQDFVYGGFFPIKLTNPPPPAELLREVFKHTNLLSYDWEFTPARIQGWIDISQLARIGLHRPQLPPGSAGMKWLKELQLRLGNCGTRWSTEKDDQISFTRESSLGLAGIELHLLVDWLESPSFPENLYSLAAESQPKKSQLIKTNSPSAR